ncbi:hypothetical protein LMG28688_06135 [Paraburkholderia caffeinitolerans]|uniref:Uncharacterized protein n=1 Tax=Paraburkholderia caffeinitolerans TaxID=1723730 RepID=A0A6J5GTF2_9BURK|nr:hypothetical protein LMG28688_06135 [Paraburkholderia caffeinitolerans]
MRPARFHKAVTNVRPYGSHRFDVFGPKIGWRLTLIGRRALQLWLRLEADPQVVTYCEGPMFVPDAGRGRAADFWVATNDGDHLYLVARSSERTCPWSVFEAWGRAHSITLRIIAPDEAGGACA